MPASRQLGHRRLLAPFTHGLKLAVGACVIASTASAQRLPDSTDVGLQVKPVGRYGRPGATTMRHAPVSWRDFGRVPTARETCCGAFQSPMAPLSAPMATRFPSSARRTTVGRRFLSGMLFGVAAAVVYAAAEKGTKRWGLPIYVGGSAVGVMVATIGREGPRPAATTIGALVGALPGVWASTAKRDPEGPGGELGLALACYFTVPLGAAIGHGVGR